MDVVAVVVAIQSQFLFGLVMWPVTMINVGTCCLNLDNMGW